MTVVFFSCLRLLFVASFFSPVIIAFYILFCNGVKENSRASEWFSVSFQCNGYEQYMPSSTTALYKLQMVQTVEQFRWKYQNWNIQCGIYWTFVVAVHSHLYCIFVRETQCFWPKIGISDGWLRLKGIKWISFIDILGHVVCAMYINYHHCHHHHTNRILHSSYFIIGCCLRAIFVLCTEHKPDSIRTSSSINHIYVDMHVCAANAIVHLSLSMGECYFSRFVF